MTKILFTGFFMQKKTMPLGCFLRLKRELKVTPDLALKNYNCSSLLKNGTFYVDHMKVKYRIIGYPMIEKKSHF